MKSRGAVVKFGGVGRGSRGADVRSPGAEEQLNGVPERSLDSVVRANGAHRIGFGGHHHKRGARRFSNGVPEQRNGRVVQADGAGERRHGGHRRDRGEGLDDRGPALRRIGKDLSTAGGSRDRSDAIARSDRAEYVRGRLVEPSSRAEWTCCSTEWRNRPLAVAERSPEGNSGPSESRSSPLESSSSLTMSSIGGHERLEMSLSVDSKR